MLRVHDDRVKVRSKVVVIHKSGDVEVNCPHCSRGVVMGKLGTVSLSKSEYPATKGLRFVVRRT